MHFDTILVTTDFSESSYAAFELSAYSSKMEGSAVTVLTVIEDWQVPEVFLRQIPNPESVKQYRDDLKQRNEEQLKALVDKHFQGAPATPVVALTERPVADEICYQAKERGADLIVIASHGRGALGTLFMGSTVQKVVAKAHCPVLVVPRTQS
jgi:nucleotide-binding universal stress UspA family protein